MRNYQLLFVCSMAAVLFISSVNGGCDPDPEKKEHSDDDGDVKKFLKNIGCNIQKGAEKVQKTAKPWVDEISKSAKEFGGTVAEKYDELKHKLTSNSTETQPNQTSATTPSEGTLATQSTPMSVDDRFLLNTERRCPNGGQMDDRGICRP